MRFQTLQEAYEGMRYELRVNGTEVVAKSSKGDSKAIELLNQSITIDDVCQINIYNPKRKFIDGSRSWKYWEGSLYLERYC